MSRRNLTKGRSHRTFTNKFRKLKKFYRLTFKNSKLQKEANKKKRYNKKDYFFEIYPTEKSFLDKIKIKLADKSV